MNTLNTERLCFPPPDLRRCIRMKLKQICLQFTLLCAFSIVALWQVSSSVQCQPLPHQLIDEAGSRCSAYSGWVLLLVKRFKGARCRISKMRQDAVGVWMLLQLLVVGFIYTLFILFFFLEGSLVKVHNRWIKLWIYCTQWFCLYLCQMKWSTIIIPG